MRARKATRPEDPSEALRSRADINFWWILSIKNYLGKHTKTSLYFDCQLRALSITNRVRFSHRRGIARFFDSVLLSVTW